MIDVQRPKELRKHLPFHRYNSDCDATESRLSELSRKVQNNVGMRKSRDMRGKRKHVKPHLRVVTYDRNESPPSSRALRMIKKRGG